MSKHQKHTKRSWFIRQLGFYDWDVSKAVRKVVGTQDFSTITQIFCSRRIWDSRCWGCCCENTAMIYVFSSSFNKLQIIIFLVYFLFWRIKFFITKLENGSIVIWLCVFKFKRNKTSMISSGQSVTNAYKYSLDLIGSVKVMWSHWK